MRTNSVLKFVFSVMGNSPIYLCGNVFTALPPTSVWLRKIKRERERERGRGEKIEANNDSKWCIYDRFLQ